MFVAQVGILWVSRKVTEWKLNPAEKLQDSLWLFIPMFHNIILSVECNL